MSNEGSDDVAVKAYPPIFLGRCQTCLCNAMLSAKPCRTGMGQGMPLFESQCLVSQNQEAYDKDPTGWTE